jgi:DNA replication protein DnaC
MYIKSMYNDLLAEFNKVNHCNFCPLKCSDKSDEVCLTCHKFDGIWWGLKQSLIPDKLQKPIGLTASIEDLENFERLANIRDNIDEFVEKGLNLYIYSDEVCGNGKTSWAIKLLLNYIIYAQNYKRDCVGLFISVPMLMLKSKLFITTKDPKYYDLLELIQEVPIVVWDEIGVCDTTNMDYLTLMTLIDYRNLAQKTNIFTSNLTGEKLKGKFDERLYSRIYESSTPIELKGCGRRGQ